MKKILVMLLAMLILFAAAAAETPDIAPLSFDDLTALAMRVQAEIITRPDFTTAAVPKGTWLIGSDLPAGVYDARSTEPCHLHCYDASGALIWSQLITADADHWIEGLKLVEGQRLKVDDLLVLAAVPGQTYALLPAGEKGD